MLAPVSVKLRNPLYGQLVIGPPGSGKTTYCDRAYELYKNLGRDVCVVNLDPGNENMKYTAALDVMDLITVEDVMKSLHLGPNGALMYCAEYLEKNLTTWLIPKLRELVPTNKYFIFDLPGQVELYTHHKAMATIFERLQQESYQLVVVNLIDSHYCSDYTKFVSTLMVTLNMMMRMGLPQVNVLSKADLLKTHEAQLPFSLDYYTDVLDLSHLLDALENTPVVKKYHKLNAAICAMIEDHSLVHYHLLNSNDNQSMLRLRNHIDKANGYIYRAAEEQSINTMLANAVGAEIEGKRHEKDIDPYINWTE